MFDPSFAPADQPIEATVDSPVAETEERRVAGNTSGPGIGPSPDTTAAITKGMTELDAV